MLTTPTILFTSSRWDFTKVYLCPSWNTWVIAREYLTFSISITYVSKWKHFSCWFYYSVSFTLMLSMSGHRITLDVNTEIQRCPWWYLTWQGRIRKGWNEQTKTHVIPYSAKYSASENYAAYNQGTPRHCDKSALRNLERRWREMRRKVFTRDHKPTLPTIVNR